MLTFGAHSWCLLLVLTFALEKSSVGCENLEETGYSVENRRSFMKNVRSPRLEGLRSITSAVPHNEVLGGVIRGSYHLGTSLSSSKAVAVRFSIKQVVALDSIYHFRRIFNERPHISTVYSATSIVLQRKATRLDAPQ